jgi:hypothetical protein
MIIQLITVGVFIIIIALLCYKALKDGKRST